MSIFGLTLFDLLQWISFLCPFLIFLDYHKKSNIGKGIIYIVAFYVGGFVFVMLAKAIGTEVIILIPIAIFLYAWIGKRLRQATRS